MRNFKLTYFVLGGSFLYYSPQNVSADSFSLFHRPNELKEVRQKRHYKKALNNQEAVHLSGLLFKNKREWRLWINGKSFSPKSWPGLTVLDVTPESVSFQFFYKGESLFFTLAPNQYYSLRDYKVGVGLP